MIKSTESSNSIVTNEEERYVQHYQVSCIACISQFVATISVSPSKENFLSIWDIGQYPKNLRFSDVSSAKFSLHIFSSRGKFTIVEIATKSNNEDSFVIIVIGCARNYLMKIELSSNFVMLDSSEIEIEESSTNISICALGDRIASLEGNDIVIRSDSLKRIRKFKCPNNELTDFDFLTIDGGYLVACFKNGLIMGWNVKTSGPIFEFDSLNKPGGARHNHNNVSLCRLVVLHQEMTAMRENNDSIELRNKRIVVASRSSMLWMIEIVPKLTTSKSSEDTRTEFICREVQSLDLQKSLRYIVSSSSHLSASPTSSSNNIEYKSNTTDKLESRVGVMNLPILAKEGHVLPLCLHYITTKTNTTTNTSINHSGKLMVCTPAITVTVNLQTFTVDSTVTLDIIEDEIEEGKKRNNSQSNGILLLNTFGTTLSVVKMSDFPIMKNKNKCIHNSYQSSYVHPPVTNRRLSLEEEEEQSEGKSINGHTLILLAIPSFGIDPICLSILLTTTSTSTAATANSAVTTVNKGNNRNDTSSYQIDEVDHQNLLTQQQQQQQQQELSYFLETLLRQLPSSSPLLSPSISTPSLAPRGKHAGYSGRPRMAPGHTASWETPHRSPRAVLDMPVTFQSRVKSSGYGTEKKVKSVNSRLRSGSAPNNNNSNTTTAAAGESKKTIPSYSANSLSLTRLLPDQRLPDRPPSPQPILQLTYSSDAKYLVAVMGGSECLTLPSFRLPFSKYNGDCTTFMGHKSRLSSATFSQDNSLLLATTDAGPVHLWRTSRGEGPALTINQCRLPESETLLASSVVGTGPGSKNGSSEDRRSVFFTENSSCYARFYFIDRFVALAYKSHVMLYSYIPGGGGTKELGDLALHTPDSGGKCRQSFVWPHVTAKNHTPTTTITALDCINSVQSKYILIATADRRILLLDAAVGQVARDIPSQHQRSIHHIITPIPSQHVTLSASSYQIFLTMATDGYLMLWDLRVPQSVYRYSNHINRTESLQAALSPDLNTIAIGSEDGSPRQIDLRNGTEINRLPAHRDVCSAVAYNPLKSHLVCGSYDGDLRFYAEPLT